MCGKAPSCPEPDNADGLENHLQAPRWTVVSLLQSTAFSEVEVAEDAGRHRQPLPRRLVIPPDVELPTLTSPKGTSFES